MTQRLHLVFGGELVSPDSSTFCNVNNIHVRNVFAKFHCLHDEEAGASPTEVRGV